MAATALVGDALEFSYVKYEEVMNGELEKVVTPMRKEQIDALGEKIGLDFFYILNKDNKIKIV